MANSSTAEFTAAPPSRPPAQIELLNWPLWDQPLLAWPTLSAAIGLAVGVALVAQAPLAGALVGVVFLICLWRMWLPVRIEIGPRGVIEVVLGRRRRIAWNAIAECRAIGGRRGKGILLSPFADSPLRIVFRGLFIHCGARREEVLACIGYYLQAVARA